MSVFLIFSANALTFVRWHLLLKAIDINIRLMTTLRLGFMGFLFGFVAPGQLGGDVFKAVFIAREQRKRKLAAIASILIDRLCGLYGLLLVTAAGLLVTGLAARHAFVNIVANATYACAIIGGFGIAVILTPGATRSRIALSATNIPAIGRAVRRLFRATELFQQRKLVLLQIGLLSLIVHLLVAIGLFAAARGIYSDSPGIEDHLVISPIAGVAGALPLFPGGAGSYEAAVDVLYDLFSPPTVAGRGVVVGLLYRFATIIVASVGLVFYWTGRREVSDVLQQVRAETELCPPGEQLKSQYDITV
ncbi:MAG: flippase-like domain-containing protein [Planctomycetales bacterium]|nr:flippase-like domain-containing protein [Planctomycetales bacterium]